LVGVIPVGMVLDHICKNTSCNNPKHMELVSPRTNVLRSGNAAAINARKTHCNKGHAYSGENLRIENDRSRTCKICAREKSRYYRALKVST
jgi:NMD protein affecting ribosome stability and mRNA decay